MLHRDLIILNSVWEIKFDRDNSGIQKGWFDDDSIEFDRTIHVPSTWNLIEPEYEGVAFYRTRFTLNHKHKGKKIRLRFGAVNYFAEVSLNGNKLSSHEGGYTPFEFDITEFVYFDNDNVLAIRVIDPPNDGSGLAIEDLKHMEIPSGKESWYVNFSGIWQDVTLVITDRTYIDDLTIIPDIKNCSVQVRLAVLSESSINGKLIFSVSTLDRKQVIVSDKRITCIEKGNNLMIVTLPLENFEYWEPDNPILYELTVRLYCEKTHVDTVSERFGMRNLELMDNFFFLNKQKIILKGLLHQQQYPKNLAYPESKEETRRIVRLLKQGGWNLIRIHIRPTTPEFLDTCDEEGMLIFEEPAIGWIVDSDMLEKRAYTEVREMVKRDRNHPSVVMWGILNESGVRGAPDILGRTKMYWNKSDMGVQRLKPDLARAIRELDESRIISDDSGAVTCNYYLPGSDKPVNYYDNHLYMSYPLSHSGFEVFRNLGKPEDFFHAHQFENFEINHRIGGGSPEKLFLQSEFGCGGIPSWPDVLNDYDDGSEVTFRDEAVYRHIDTILHDYYDRELNSVFNSYEDLLGETREVQAASVRRMIEALRANKLCAGYVLTQLHDNDYECNAGILDPLFQPKPAYKAAQEANRPLRIILETWKRTVFPGGIFSIVITVINDTGFSGTAELTITITDPADNLLSEENLSVTIESGIQDIYTSTISVGNDSGACTTRAELYKDGKLLDSAEYKNYVILPLETNVDMKHINLIVFDGAVSSWLDDQGIPVNPVNTDFYIIEPVNKNQLNDSRITDVLHKVKYDGVSSLFLGLPLICLSDADEELQELRNRGKYVCWCSPTELETDVFGFPISYYDSKPRFVGPYHYFKKHSVFDGLDPGHILDDRFANIMPLTSVRIDGAEKLGGSFGTPIGYHFKIRGCKHARDLRYGSDLAVVPYGKGRLIISTYRIAENLGKDPVADRLLWNMLKTDAL